MATKCKFWNTLYSLNKVTKVSNRDDQHKIDSKPINGKNIICRSCKVERQTRKSRHDGVNGYRCVECGKFHAANF